ncbi:MAG: DEAD/DEAH box helicase [Spartobacteria bacterium]|nr:DEAD/DEAH box helicase [Spartobacteria bacterium]
MKANVPDRTAIKLPPKMNWRTSDEDEINRRRVRAIEEQPDIRNLTPAHPVFSNFEITSASGMTYYVEIRDLAHRQFHSTTVDFMINGLGTDKHVEAVLNYLQSFHADAYRRALEKGSNRIDIVPDGEMDTLRVERNLRDLPPALMGLFDERGILQACSPEEAVARLSQSRSRKLRISQEIAPWLEARQLAEDRVLSRRDYEWRVRSGSYPGQETKLPLFPYQRQGMLHLAFTERAMLADEMGLGKTVQAVAACALLQRLNKAQRVLVVAPASLKTEWEEQIRMFTELPYQLIFGGRKSRLYAYEHPTFFSIVNYEQVVRDVAEINALLKPDIVILDEAQRIKNWPTKTAQAIKRVQSRYAFVLTGTPIENRLDELYSIINFIDPALFGPLFRFNREYYLLDERGRPAGYCNLVHLHKRIAPVVLRRRKSDVEDQLPSRTDEHYYVPLTPEQRTEYDGLVPRITRLLKIAENRGLSKQESDLLMKLMNMARMICDTNYILNPKERACPKLDELGRILEEAFSEPDTKVVIFSEWKRMLELVSELLDSLGVKYAVHTGDISQKRRRGEINMFKSDPACRAFISTESGGAGLNLQNANVVINCDLPWNPAKLEQRIARVWRKNQKRNVTVINLISEETIEHKMIQIHEVKRGLAEGVLDDRGDYDTYNLKDRRQSFIKRLKQVMEVELPEKSAGPPRPVTLPPDRSLGMMNVVSKRFGKDILWAEEQYPEEAACPVILIVARGDADKLAQKIQPLYEEYFGADVPPDVKPGIEIIDEAGFKAIQRLQEMGVLAGRVRSKRSLFPPRPASPEPLPEATQARLSDWSMQIERKIKTVNVLTSAGLAGEAKPALQDILLLSAKMCALTNGLPEPESADAINAMTHHLQMKALQDCRALLEDLPPNAIPGIIQTCRTVIGAQGTSQ